MTSGGPQDGWEPLGELLGVDVPDEPLPNLNDTQAFRDAIIGGAVASIGGWWEKERPEER